MLLYSNKTNICVRAQEYSSGRMLSGEIKKELVQVITPLILEHQRARATITDDIVRAFLTPRRLEFGK